MAKKQQITDDNIISFLHESNIEADDIQGSDPLVSSRIKITLDQLKPYDNNPRSTQNPKFDSIMASIENRGLDNPPNISRRPGEEHYIILDGGNTRLEILNTLHKKYMELAQNAETDEARFELSDKANKFYEFECVFKPWSGESSALAGHMAENEERGETKFIEKALAVQKFREIYQEEDRKIAKATKLELKDKPLSIRKLAERITTQGWTISHTHITRFDYAANVLFQVIPECLWAGAGEPIIRQIRKHETAYNEFWKNTEAGQLEPEKIQEHFFSVLHEFDQENIDLKGFLNALNLKLSEIVKIEPQIIMAEIEAIIRGVPRDSSSSSTDTGVDDVIQNYKETSSSPVKIPAASQSDNTGRKTSTKDSHDNENDPSKNFDDLKRRLISLINTVTKYYPGLGISEQADNFMSLAMLPPHHPDPDFSFQFNEDDDKAVTWWFLFRRTISFDGIPREGIQASILGWFQNYTHLGNFMDVVLYLEQAFLDLPREVKQLLHDIQLIIDEMYAQYKTKNIKH